MVHALWGKAPIFQDCCEYLQKCYQWSKNFKWCTRCDNAGSFPKPTLLVNLRLWKGQVHIPYFHLSHFSYRDVLLMYRGVKMHLKACIVFQGWLLTLWNMHVKMFSLLITCMQRLLLFLIKYILSINTQWLLCGKLLVPTFYDSHQHAFRVKVDQDWSVIKSGQKIDCQSLDLYHIDDKLYVTLGSVWNWVDL